MTEGGDHGTSLYGNYISISDVLEICSEHWCQTIRALELRRTENPSKAGISDLRCLLPSLNLANIILRIHRARGRPILACDKKLVKVSPMSTSDPPREIFQSAPRTTFGGPLGGLLRGPTLTSFLSHASHRSRNLRLVLSRDVLGAHIWGERTVR